MSQMLDYIDDCGGQIVVTHLVLMPKSGLRTLDALVRRAYVRQNNCLDIVILPRDLDTRLNRVGSKLIVPDLENL